MTKVNDETPTPANVADQATQADAVPLGRLTLIGVAGAPDNRRALILLASGQVITGSIGSDTPAGQIIAIAEATVVLRKGSQSVTLNLPKG